MPPAKKLSRREATRQRVLAKAIEHVRSSGAAGLSVEQVSKEVGVTRQTTYNHFSTKQDLLFVIAQHESERQAVELSGRLQASMDSDDRSRLAPADLIAEGILMLVELAHEDPAAGLLLTADTPLEAWDAVALRDAAAGVMRLFWEPLLGRLDGAGVLASTVGRTVTWLTFMHFVLVSLPGFERGRLDALRREIDTYVSPAVLHV